MKILETSLNGVLLIQPDVYEDDRGIFKVTFNESLYRKAKIEYKYLQDNLSVSKKNVLRGLHFQKSNPQGKLVTCIRGQVLDVVVDIDKNSNTFGQYYSVTLSDSNHKQLWIPPGYAHGFYVLSSAAHFLYKCTSYYDPNSESGIIWNDPALSIKWPTENPILSLKDQNLPTIDKIF